jgi:tungstate transport system substrate-binding protein
MAARFIRVIPVVLSLLLLAQGVSAQEKPTATYGAGPQVFALATGSPGELGLLKVLAESFDKEQKGQTTLQWFKAGSGKSLQLLKDKKVDMIMVHAPKAEKQAVQDGWAANRVLIGSNEFFIVGPARTRPRSPRPKARPRLIKRSPAPRPNSSPGATIPAPIRKKWTSGSWPISSRRGLVRGHQGFHDRHPEAGQSTTRAISWWTAAPGRRKRKTCRISRCCSRATRPWSTPITPWLQPAGATPGAAVAVKFIDFVASPAGAKDHRRLRQRQVWRRLV